MLSTSSEFCSMVRKIYIYTYDEAKRLLPKVKVLVLKGGEISKNNAATDADASRNGDADRVSASVVSDKDS